MVPEDLVFWIATLEDAPLTDAVLCRHHADAMVVPRGWTLDDRRESVFRLFRPRSANGARDAVANRPRPRRSALPADERPEQLQIDGTGEIERPAVIDDSDDSDDSYDADDFDDVVTGGTVPWEPDFDHDDDLGGLLEVNSPLLARAFRGTDRPKRRP